MHKNGFTALVDLQMSVDQPMLWNRSGKKKRCGDSIEWSLSGHLASTVRAWPRPVKCGESTTGVWKTEVRTTGGRRQQCESQQCDYPVVRLPTVGISTVQMDNRANRKRELQILVTSVKRVRLVFRFVQNNQYRGSDTRSRISDSNGFVQAWTRTQQMCKDLLTPKSVADTHVPRIHQRLRVSGEDSTTREATCARTFEISTCPTSHSFSARNLRVLTRKTSPERDWSIWTPALPTSRTRSPLVLVYEHLNLFFHIMWAGASRPSQNTGSPHFALSNSHYCPAAF